MENRSSRINKSTSKPTNRLRKAVFLDKDGTLIENVPYNVDPARIRFSPGAEDCLCRLQDAGYELVIVSNQSGVARGYFSEEMLRVVRECLAVMFAGAGVNLLDFRYCPHHPDGVITRYSVACSCRKPAPGMLVGAALAHSIDLNASWMIGDILDDVEAGWRAGCSTILLNNGNETVWLLSNGRMPDFVADSLTEAADVIIGNSRSVRVA